MNQSTFHFIPGTRGEAIKIYRGLELAVIKVHGILHVLVAVKKDLFIL